MATHPPLATRIKRIEPRWQGEFPSVEAAPIMDENSESAPVSHFQGNSQPSTSNMPQNPLEEAIEFSGDPTHQNLMAGDILLISLPTSLKEASHQAFSARALIYALLLDESQDIRNAQVAFLKKNAHPATYKQFITLAKEVINLPNKQRFTLINLCAPALKQQSSRQLSVFKRNLLALIKADKKITLFEWCIYRLVIKNASTDAKNSSFTGSNSIRKSLRHVERLMLTVSMAGKNQNALKAYNDGREVLSLDKLTALPKVEDNFIALDQSLNQLEKLAPLQKPKVLKAIAAVVESDGNITEEEEVLFRIISDAIDCPIPPTLLT